MILLHDSVQQVFLADTAYVLELIMMVLLFLSFYYASERNFKAHKKIMRIMIIIQTVLVLYMVGSLLFSSYGKNFMPHAIVGTFVYSLIIYTWLLMEGKINHKLFALPVKYRKNLMRIVMVLWGLTIFFGAYSYLTIID